jgi:hypothetical protein
VPFFGLFRGTNLRSAVAFRGNNFGDLRSWHLLALSEKWKWLNLSTIVSVEIHRESDGDSSADESAS